MTFSSLKEGLIYQDSGEEGYMAFYMHQPRRGLWGCFMLRYTHTKSIEATERYLLRHPLGEKGNSPIHSSVAVHLTPASTVWPWRQCFEGDITTDYGFSQGLCATKPWLLTQLLPAPHVGSHCGWGWPWVNVGAEEPGRMLDQKCVAKLTGRNTLCLQATLRCLITRVNWVLTRKSSSQNTFPLTK